jgi:hypothetical protein
MNKTTYNTYKFTSGQRWDFYLDNQGHTCNVVKYWP